MSFEQATDELYIHAFDAFGIDVLMKRGNGPDTAVRAIVRYGVEKLGDYGQVVALLTTADFMVEQWAPKQGDQMTWTDLQGEVKTRALSNEISGNGYVAKGVLHG